jgi:hypothetical protein
MKTASSYRNELTSVPIIGPGVMMLEVIPRGPYSIEVVADRASMPAFATATCDCKAMPV